VILVAVLLVLYLLVLHDTTLASYYGTSSSTTSRIPASVSSSQQNLTSFMFRISIALIISVHQVPRRGTYAPFQLLIVDNGDQTVGGMCNCMASCSSDCSTMNGPSVVVRFVACLWCVDRLIMRSFADRLAALIAFRRMFDHNSLVAAVGGGVILRGSIYSIILMISLLFRAVPFTVVVVVVVVVVVAAVVTINHDIKNVTCGKLPPCCLIGAQRGRFIRQIKASIVCCSFCSFAEAMRVTFDLATGNTTGKTE
jgi:hypothetical protein